MSNSTPRAALPPLPERAGYAPALKSDIYTAEQVEAIRREAVMACFQAVAKIRAGVLPEDAILALLPVKEPKE